MQARGILAVYELSALRFYSRRRHCNNTSVIQVLCDPTQRDARATHRSSIALHYATATLRYGALRHTADAMRCDAMPRPKQFPHTRARTAFAPVASLENCNALSKTQNETTRSNRANCRLGSFAFSKAFRLLLSD